MNNIDQQSYRDRHKKFITSTGKIILMNGPDRVLIDFDVNRMNEYENAPHVKENIEGFIGKIIYGLPEQLNRSKNTSPASYIIF